MIHDDGEDYPYGSEIYCVNDGGRRIVVIQRLGNGDVIISKAWAMHTAYAGVANELSSQEVCIGGTPIPENRTVEVERTTEPYDPYTELQIEEVTI